jgi:hypothetical protein
VKQDGKFTNAEYADKYSSIAFVMEILQPQYGNTSICTQLRGKPISMGLQRYTQV